MTPEQQAAADKYRARIADKEQQRAETPTQRTRTILQGVTFGGADELEAFLRKLSGEDYETALNEIRGGLKAYQQARPGEALALEVGGAAAPALLASVFTGGGSLAALGARFPTLLKAAKAVGIAAPETLVGAGVVGGVQGATTGFLTGEGEGDRIRGAATGFLTGAPIGLGMDIAGKAATRPIIALVDIARRKLGSKAGAAVEKEIQRIAADANLTPEQVAQDLADGSLVAENATLRDAVRSYRATGGPAATKLKEGLEGRTAETRAPVVEGLEVGLTGQSGGNILKRQSEKLSTIKDKANELYNSPFAKQPVPPQLASELQSLFQGVPGAFDEVITAMKAKGEKPFFRMDGDKLVITGQPTIAQAERVRRAIANKADSLWKNSQGDAAKAFGEVEMRLRGLIDNISPETQAARQTWRQMSNQGDAFDAGRSAMKATPDIDQSQIDFDRFAAMGPDELQAFRTGAMAKLRVMLGSGSASSTIKKLLNEDNAQGQLLRTIFPEQDLPNMLKRLQVAKTANEAANEILGQSPTAVTQQQIKRQGGDIGVLDIAEAGGFNPIAIARLGQKLLSKSRPELTDQNRLDVVNVLLSRDPDYIVSILRDESGVAKFQELLERTANATIAGTTRAVIQQQEPIRENIFGALGAAQE